MKIKQVHVRASKIKLKETFTIALGTIESADSAIVEIETEEGLVGYGEGGPGIFITGETLAGTIETIELFGQAIIGLNPFNIEKIHEVMDKISAFALAAKAAIDIACYDLMGQKAQLPLYQLLGGYDNQVITDITLGIDEPNVMAQKAVEKVKLGFDTLKIKVGTGIEADIARVKAIREAVGFDIKLRLDYQIELVEQPVKRRDLEGLKYVTSQVNTTIMADESCFDAQDALELVKKGTVDVINIKLMKCGGIHEALKINQICETAGIECMIGCMAEETTIGITAAAHLAAAQKNITRADLDATFGLETAPVTGGVSLEAKPLLELGEAAGLGISH